MSRRLAHAIAPLVLFAGACGNSGDEDPATAAPPPTEGESVASGTAPPTTTAPARESNHGTDIDEDALLTAYLGAAPFQDVAVAEAEGWAGTIDTLGCFENAEEGGMGVHWLNESLLDAELDPARPEALVYELDADGEIAGLVGHEYLVPLEAWSGDEPPALFGQELHEHPVLPFWILHLYIWKANPAGLFADWNPAVRMCPDGVPVFGEDPASPDDPAGESTSNLRGRAR